jgi:hypothetical protein
MDSAAHPRCQPIMPGGQTRCARSATSREPLRRQLQLSPPHLGRRPSPLRLLPCRHRRPNPLHRLHNPRRLPPRQPRQPSPLWRPSRSRMTLPGTKTAPNAISRLASPRLYLRLAVHRRSRTMWLGVMIAWYVMAPGRLARLKCQPITRAEQKTRAAPAISRAWHRRPSQHRLPLDRRPLPSHTRRLGKRTRARTATRL